MAVCKIAQRCGGEILGASGVHVAPGLSAGRLFRTIERGQDTASPVLFVSGIRRFSFACSPREKPNTERKNYWAK